MHRGKHWQVLATFSARVIRSVFLFYPGDATKNARHKLQQGQMHTTNCQKTRTAAAMDTPTDTPVPQTSWFGNGNGMDLVMHWWHGRLHDMAM